MWKKGQSGNPKGAPRKDFSWRSLIIQVAEEFDQTTNKKNKIEVVRSVFRQAKAGNVNAAKLLMEKSVEPSAFSGEFSGVITLKPELLEKLNEIYDSKRSS
jgi:hypothetical protein